MAVFYVNINAAIAQLGEALSASGLNVYSVVSNGAFPAAVIQPPEEIRYVTSYGGTCAIDIRVALYVSAADLPSGFQLLYSLLSYNMQGTTPVPDALYNYSATAYRRLNVTRAGSFDYDEATNSLTADLYLTIEV